MNSVVARFANCLRISASSSLAVSEARTLTRGLRGYSTKNDSDNNDDAAVGEEEYEEILSEKPEFVAQGVDPRKGWNFRGVHKAILCGKVGQAPVQKILRNGRTVTILTVGTAGMFDQRIVGKDLPKPAQWHRVVIHNEFLGAYAVQQLTKNSAVYVEGDIETRVYNDSITGQVKNIPEICIRVGGMIRLAKSGGEGGVSKISFDDLRKGLF